MSHPNPAGNGCSLEDCYTNLFALTDICGIKWRRLATNPDANVPVDHLEDPVLVSYSKCIQSDILCVWRRIQTSAGEQHTDHLSFNKELWIFWYGDEPANLDSHVSKDLTEKETGSWDKGKDHGLSYECRTLLFKALHNLIERCLLTKGFIRLGRWFVQPYDTHSHNSERQTHLSFSFNFFLHGESSVCASIEVKQHPPVWKLTSQHLTLTQENHNNFQVILAPYGLNGTLTGQSYRDADQQAHKILDEWSRFYPIEKTDKEGDPPALIEVLVAGVRMKYPSSFVLLCDIDDQLKPQTVNPVAPASNLPHPPPAVPHSHLTPPASPADMNLLGDHGAKGAQGSLGYGAAHHLDISSELIARSERVFSKRIQEKVIQDNCINNVIAKRSAEAPIDDSTVGMWDFNDPTTKQNCNCSRHRLLKNKPPLSGPNKGQPLATNKHGKGDVKPDKVDRPPSRLGRSAPFHRQTTVGDASLDIDLLVQRVPVQGVGFTPAPVATALPQLNNSGEGNTGVESVQSPAAVPSPLEEPHSQSHASQSGEPTMPKLSPHPPPEVPEKEGNVAKPPANNSSNLVNGHVDFAKPFDVSTPKTAEHVFSPPTEQSEAKNASINRWIKSNHLQHKLVEIPGIKRPLLPTQLTDGDDFVTQNLYNLDRLNLWLNIPVVKKPKYEPLSPDEESANLQKLRSSPQSMEDDPYEFSDEASINPATITNRKMRDSQEGFHNKKSPFSGKMDEDYGKLDSNRDEKGNEPSSLTSPPATPNTLKDSLMQVNDLVPKKTDLDHIFESDSDNDDPFISNTENAVSEDIKHTRVLMAPTEGVIASSDLIRMYPTPPSNNPEISPASYHHEAVETYERPVIKKEINVPSMEEFFKDVPCVFQPPEQDEFVSSDKYSNVMLPKLSPIHHPPDYKASWQFPMPIMEKPPPNSYNIPSIENIPSLSSRMTASAIESSPMFQTPSVGPQRTPMSYELQSPASNASSYLNKTLNSVDNQGTNNQIAEVHSLVVNILLMDSRLNVFKDANFDSCNFCVCNGNIKGADTGILIEDPTGEAQYSCTCGFSAIRNRRFGINAGLFYEDEVDITGVRNDRFDRRKPGLLSLEFSGEHKGDDPNILVLELLLGQFTVPYPSHSSSQLLLRLAMDTDTSYASVGVDDFPLKDGNEVSYAALDQGRQAMEHCVATKIDDPVMKSTCLHKWQFFKGATKIPLNPQDSQHLLKSLQPILQDAIQNKRVTRLWEQTFKLAGPLTWKEFHQLAGRGSEENSSPQPIPALLVGNDRDWLSVSPYSLRFWEKQFMEPYGKQRDIAYVVLAPDNNYVIDYVKIFFKELSNVYELCRFGRHAPFAKKLRDGIMRIGKKQAATKSEEPEDDWFKQVGESPLTNKLKLFSQVCTSWLAPLLSQQTLDQSVFEPNTNYRAGYKPSEPSQVTSDHVFTIPQSNNVADDKENTQTAESNNFKDISFHENDREKPMDCPALVVYIIDPFNYGQSSDGQSDIERIIKIGLLKCFLKLVQSLPEHLQQNMYLQIIPLHTVLECTEKGSNTQQLKAISFSVFTTCRWNSSHTILGRSLTGFGPAAAAEIFLKTKKDQKEKAKLYCPPFVIAPTKDKQALLAECHGEKLERSNIIHCTYCLSEDQRWLIAVCTDEQGELMETVTINIEIPNRNRRKKASARKIGLKKLWDFILGVVTMTSIPSRLVIGRFGRMGHGELKGWSGLLSKKNIQKAHRHIKELCPNVCSLLSGNSEIPGILSVCLISLESHSSFQVLADVVKAEEKMSSNCPLQTPQDASCTHILVFPTSANAQANSTTMITSVGDNLGLGNIDDVMDDENILSNLQEDFKMDNDFNDGFLINVFEEITNSPNTVLPGGNTSNPGSPTDNGRHSLSAMNSSTSHSQDLDPQDEPPNLLQQPLAMGYLVSSSETGPLPKWFWSACPENEHHKPHTFKAALHIQSNQEEFMPSSHHRNSHPLDSSITCDVLRYVLENYNALSWLTFDPVKNDRQSSLPIHMVVLMQMYHALNAFL